MPVLRIRRKVAARPGFHARVLKHWRRKHGDTRLRYERRVNSPHNVARVRGMLAAWFANLGNVARWKLPFVVEKNGARRRLRVRDRWWANLPANA